MYGTMDLHYEGCADGSYCNCCSCADDVGFVRAMLAWLEANFCVDRRRVFATGCSYGGMMTYQLGLSMPGTFAALAPAFGGLLKGFAVHKWPCSYYRETFFYCRLYLKKKRFSGRAGGRQRLDPDPGHSRSVDALLKKKCLQRV